MKDLDGQKNKNAYALSLFLQPLVLSDAAAPLLALSAVCLVQAGQNDDARIRRCLYNLGEAGLKGCAGNNRQRLCGRRRRAHLPKQHFACGRCCANNMRRTSQVACVCISVMPPPATTCSRVNRRARTFYLPISLCAPSYDVPCVAFLWLLSGATILSRPLHYHHPSARARLRSAPYPFWPGAARSCLHTSPATTYLLTFTLPITPVSPVRLQRPLASRAACYVNFV